MNVFRHYAIKAAARLSAKFNQDQGITLSEWIESPDSRPEAIRALENDGVLTPSVIIELAYAYSYATSDTMKPDKYMTANAGVISGSAGRYPWSLDTETLELVVQNPAWIADPWSIRMDAGGIIEVLGKPRDRDLARAVFLAETAFGRQIGRIHAPHWHKDGLWCDSDRWTEYAREYVANRGWERSNGDE
jgi:hypothetical protein